MTTCMHFKFISMNYLSMTSEQGVVHGTPAPRYGSINSPANDSQGSESGSKGGKGEDGEECDVGKDRWKLNE